MRSSVSDHSFYLDSEDEQEQDHEHEQDEEKPLLQHLDDGNDSEMSASLIDDREHFTPNSYDPSWPRSYRQSIDVYGSVLSPSIILGTPTLERFASSFRSSTLIQRHPPEIAKSLLSTPDSQQQDKSSSSHFLLPPLSSRRSSHIKGADLKSFKSVHEFPASRRSSYGQAVLNGVNVLCGVGILSTPYAVKEGGWMSLSILFLFALLSLYTGVLLRSCLDSAPGLETYPDIGQAAFGKIGRIAISIILYVELYACCVEYVILESDNLSSLFPNASLNLGFCILDARHLFALAATLAVLPTCWLRDLSILSYISAGGVIASILVVLCLYWIGLVDHVGYFEKGTTLNLSSLPVAIGLYGYCYSGHAVFPNIYTSMENRNQYPSVLVACFGICTLLYGGAAVLGYMMFGQSTESQFTLNLPHELTASKIAVWTTVVNPFTKFALTISPVAMSLEELLPRHHQKSHFYPVLIRTSLVVSTLLVGMSIPFFGLVMALIGSLLTMLVTLILPCACYLSILRERVTRLQVTMCTAVIVVGIVSSGIGTYSALAQIIERLK